MHYLLTYSLTSHGWEPPTLEVQTGRDTHRRAAVQARFRLGLALNSGKYPYQMNLFISSPSAAGIRCLGPASFAGEALKKR